MRLFTRNVSITKRLGFSDIIIPGGIISFYCHYAALLHHITIEFMFCILMQMKALALRYLLSLNRCMVMWPLRGICSNGLIVSLCSKLIALQCKNRFYRSKILFYWITMKFDTSQCLLYHNTMGILTEDRTVWIKVDVEQNQIDYTGCSCFSH